MKHDLDASEETPPGAPPAEPKEPQPSRLRNSLPIALVVAAVIFNLWVLRGEATHAAPLNDNAVHESMVRWAGQRLADGHLPLDGWYPYLDLGLPQFHHYQSLSHSITAAASLVTGVDRTFSWTVYLLLSLWPVAVYASARLWGLGRWSAAGAALISPLLVSTPSYGYEHGSYVWRGWGLFPQLWAMWTLPFAWALGWRAVARRGSLLAASALVAVTIAFHFLTGYLALAALAVWVLVRPSELLRRLGRAAVVAGGAIGLAAWVVIPVFLDTNWTHASGSIEGTFWADSYGARQVMSWFAGGELFDTGRLAVVTALVVVGIVAAARQWKENELSRALVGVLVLSLLLFFGRTTFGGWLDVLPFSGDLLLHRFIMGVHLAGIFIAGVGAAWIGRGLLDLSAKVPIRLPSTATITAIAVAGVVGLAPAWIERIDFNNEGAQWLREQRAADETDGEDVAALVDVATLAGAGRIYAGASNNWGAEYRVGQVPVYAELLNNDAAGHGFLFRTLSLMSEPSQQFNEADPSHYALFNITHLILPSDRPPLVPATFVTGRGRHTLWTVPQRGYISTIATADPIRADRTDLGEKVAGFMASGLPAANAYPLVLFPGTNPGPITLTADTEAQTRPTGLAFDLPDEGRFGARLTVPEPLGIVVLRASYHGRWRATVDGQHAPIFMVAPAFPAVAVPPGERLVVFRYEGFRYYWLLGLVGLATGLLLWLGPKAWAPPRGVAP